MKLLIVALAVLLAYPAQAIEQSGNTITLTDAEADLCRAGGGCVVVPLRDLQQALREMAEKGRETCKRKDA